MRLPHLTVLLSHEGSVLNPLLHYFNYIRNLSVMKVVAKSPLKDPLKDTQYSDDKVKIIIRLRPVLGDEDQEKFVNLEDLHTLKIMRPGNHSHMRFNNILPSDSTQKDLFHLMSESVESFLEGVNNTIFAYGQTGAGKTYSIIGDYSHLDSRDNLETYLMGSERGILSRSLEHILHEKVKRRESSRISISFIEVYNQKIFDLINHNTMNALDIRESKQGEIEIMGIHKQEVNTMEEAISLVSIGLKNRVTGSTHANSKSSRSHSIFQIIYDRVVKVGNVEEIRSSSLKIVDLAGSEKYKIPCDLTPSEREVRLQELTSINGSLSCLGHCISALIQKSRTHIPFRNSKLTRILSDSLVGPGKMKFIVCISPSVTASAETFSTLQFANRAKKAILDRTPKHSLSKKSSVSEEFNALKGEYERERALRTEVEGQMKALQQKVLETDRENKMLRKENEELRQKARHPSLVVAEETSNLLKLSVFKENKELMNQNQPQYPPSQTNGYCKLNVPPPHPKRISTLEQKKQLFQKRVQTFIQKDSPTNSSKVPGEYSFGRVEYQFHTKERSERIERSERSQRSGSSERQEEEPCYGEQTFELYEECQSLFRSEATQSESNFIEKTCKNMNVRCLTDLKEDMLRARKELKYFQEKDNYLEELKLSNCPNRYER